MTGRRTTPHDQGHAQNPYTVADIRANPCLIRLVPAEQQTPEICLLAVQDAGDLLKYVKQQTPAICLAAVKNNPWALADVEQQTPEICLAAVRKHYSALQLVQEQTPEICLAAIGKFGRPFEYGMALKFVNNQSEAICRKAIENGPMTIRFVTTQTLPLCLLAIKKSGDTLEHIVLPHDQLMNPTSGQLNNWLAILSACRRTNIESIESTIYALIDNVSLGKQFCNEWQCQDGDGHLLLDKLTSLASEMKRLAPKHEKVVRFCHEVNVQIEFSLSAPVLTPGRQGNWPGYEEPIL